MIVRTKEQAWQAADELYITDYVKDEYLSMCAGYPIYCNPYGGNLYIRDLNTRLEVDLITGDTINIWIDENLMTEEKIQTPYGTITRYKPFEL